MDRRRSLLCQSGGKRGKTKDEGRTTNDGRRTADDERPVDEISPEEMADGEGPDGEGPDGKMSAQIADLDARIARLGAYIDARHDECAVADLCRLLDLHSMMLSRVTRMRQVQNALHGAQTRMMAFLYGVLGLILQDKKILPEPDQPEPDQPEPDQPEPDQPSRGWVQVCLPCVSEG